MKVYFPQLNRFSLALGIILSLYFASPSDVELSFCLVGEIATV